jgi:glycosyltransferase involved in cell wall biosynthesis
MDWEFGVEIGQRVIFDVSDVVKYAIGNSSVSGIQRVQLKIISEFCHIAAGGPPVLVSYCEPESLRFFYADPGRLFVEPNFNAENILARLGLIRRKFLPEKFRVKRYLKRYETNKLRRSLEKVKVYAMAFTARAALRRMQVLTAPGVSKIEALPREPMGELAPGDIYVLLGSFWDYDEVMQKAARHRAAGGRVVALIHDLIPLVAQDYSTSGLTRIFRDFVPRIPDVAGALLAVSPHSASDAEKVLSLPAGSVQALGLAHEFSGFPRHFKAVQRRLDLPGSFALCVGTIEIRKNGLLLLKVWKRLIDEGLQNLPDLVFAGKYGWRISEFKGYLSSHPALEKKVRIVNSPADEDLAELYTRASFCLFPSFYEGWGLPVGEAAWFDRYVIASSASSVPEVCGGLMDYAAPDDIDAWVALVKRACQSPEYVRAKERAIREAPLRNWRDVALNLQRLL